MQFFRSSSRWLPVVLVVGLLAFATFFFGPDRVLRLARDAVRPAPELGDLPLAAGWSLLRMGVAYAASLVFAFIVGTWAATSRRAGRILLPLLDVGQSVPVLGFFPAAIYVFITLLGGGRFALECAAIFLIFTSQTWNLAFAVYEGLTTIPPETRAAADSLRLRGLLRWRTLYVPACIPTLLYNSILSWANGWYFLIACEIIVAGPVQYDLPGLGSMLSHALAAGDFRVAAAALGTLIGLVLGIEFLVWRPLRAWSRRYRYDPPIEETDGAPSFLPDFGLPVLIRPVRAVVRAVWRRLPVERVNRWFDAAGDSMARVWGVMRWPVWALLAALIVFALGAVVRAIAPPWPGEASSLPLKLLYSFLRINVAYVLALLWVVPVALWASEHPRGMRWLSTGCAGRRVDPCDRVLPRARRTVREPLRRHGIRLHRARAHGHAVVPAVQHALGRSARTGRPQGVASLHGPLAHADLATSRVAVVHASLVTGSVVAWGGAWNALILSEYVVYRDQVYSVPGIGEALDRAIYETGDRTMLFLSLALIVITVVTFNRLVWGRLYRHVQTRYQLEG